MEGESQLEGILCCKTEETFKEPIGIIQIKIFTLLGLLVFRMATLVERENGDGWLVRDFTVNNPFPAIDQDLPCMLLTTLCQRVSSSI